MGIAKESKEKPVKWLDDRTSYIVKGLFLLILLPVVIGLIFAI